MLGGLSHLPHTPHPLLHPLPAPLHTNGKSKQVNPIIANTVKHCGYFFYPGVWPTVRKLCWSGYNKLSSRILLFSKCFLCFSPNDLCWEKRWIVADLWLLLSCYRAAIIFNSLILNISITLVRKNKNKRLTPFTPHYQNKIKQSKQG